MMRFKKGSKVEVMCKKEIPNSWRCAEIVAGNGHTYSVKYGLCPDLINEKVLERVSRKVIRPCPPPMGGAQSWVAGDIVEVLHEVSWKTATVLKDFGMDYYLVRLHGSSQECRVHKSGIRMRHFWQDDQWVLIGKGSGSFGDAKSNELSTSKCYLKTSLGVPQEKKESKPQAEHDCYTALDKTGIRESRIESSRTLKRALPYSSSHLEATAGRVLKLRAIEKEGRKEPVITAPLLEKGHSWRHASLASKGLKMMPGFAASLLATMG